MKTIKSNPSQIIKVLIENTKNIINIKTIKEIKQIKLNEIPIMDRYSNGSYVVKNRVLDVYEENTIMNPNEINEQETTKTIEENKQEIKTIKEETKKEPSLKQIDDSFMTIDDLLNNIK